MEGRGGRRLGGDGRVDGQELGAVGEGPLDLDVVDERCHARLHLPPPEQLLTRLHQFGDRRALADHLEHLGGDERDRLGVVEPEPAREAALRELAHLSVRARTRVSTQAGGGPARRSDRIMTQCLRARRSVSLPARSGGDRSRVATGASPGGPPSSSPPRAAPPRAGRHPTSARGFDASARSR